MDRTGELVAEIERARTARAEANAALWRSLRAAARYLVHEQGMTMREAGRQMGVSHQRVCTLLDAVTSASITIRT